MSPEKKRGFRVPLLRAVWGFLRSFRAVRLGVSPNDKFWIAARRVAFLFVPLQWASLRLTRRPLVRGSRRTVRCRQDGLVFHVPSGRQEEILFEDAEREVKAAVLSERSGDFIDIGAAIGAYAMKAARDRSPGGRVIAVEPDPERSAALRMSVEENGLHNVEVLAAAIWSSSGSVRLYKHMAGGAPIDNSVVHQVSPVWVDVPALTLDELVSTRGLHPRVIKIDTEGAEEDILKGAKRTLASAPDLRVVYEALTPASANACEKLLEESGYEVRPIDGYNFLATRARVKAPQAEPKGIVSSTSR